MNRLLALLLLLPSAACAGEWIPSEMAAGSFRSDAGLSFRVGLKKGWPVLGRTTTALANPRSRLHPVYEGATVPLLTVAFADDQAPKPRLEQEAWDHQIATYALPGGGSASLLLSRLTPAVLAESTGDRIAFTGAAPKHVAFVVNGRPVVHPAASLAELPADQVKLTEPWLLAWFGTSTPLKGSATPIDVGDRTGVSKARLMAGLSQPLDLPLLFRLEHAPKAIDARGGLAFTFAGGTGKIAVMPLAGGRIFLPEETEGWAKGLPEPILERCRRWSVWLRDIPLTVSETFSVAEDGGSVTVRQQFTWTSFDDDWRSPQAKAAPVPPMLATALGGGVPVRFFQAGKEVEPADCRFMAAFGRMMVLEGADAYEYRIDGLEKYLWRKREPRAVAPEAKPIQAKLERRVADTVAAGHLAPLLYIYGGIGGTRFAHFHWIGSPELAHALATACPYLSPALQEKVKAYLKAEWEAYPPFTIEPSWYRKGTWRAPYDMPWDEMTRHMVLPIGRDIEYRKASFFIDLYRALAWYSLAGETDDAGELEDVAAEFTERLARRQDWAILGPSRLRSVRDRHRLRYFTLQGQATTNRWLAGLIGAARLARQLGWKDREKLATYLFAKLAMARVAQARYVPEMHRMGLVRGKAVDDWRTLLHIDATCVIVGWGGIAAGVHQDQELPPFIDLVEEVGRLLGDYARPECRIYLGHLDAAIPFWYLSEAPKQGATEHRTCPLQHLSGNVLAQYWILGKRGKAFTRYIDTTRFTGDLYTIHNLTTAIDSFAE